MRPSPQLDVKGARHGEMDEDAELDEQVPDDTQFSSEGPIPPVATDGAPPITASERAYGRAEHDDHHDHGGDKHGQHGHGGKHYDRPTDTKSESRFGGDEQLEEIALGTRTVKKGDHGTAVVKLQQALIDLGYTVDFGVDGIFGDGTEKALEAFQTDNSLTPSLELDQATIQEMHGLYDTRKPYIDNAKHDAKDPGTRKLTKNQKKLAKKAMVRGKGAGGAPKVFTEEVGGQHYGDRVKDNLTKLIAFYHKDLYEDKAALRADPAKNFHDWSTLEGPAQAAKDVTDGVYDSNYGGAAAFPAMTNAGGNLVDQWDDELQLNKGLDKDQKKDKARNKVWYLINSDMPTTNREHGAVPSDAEEKKILKPIVESFISDDAKVQTMLELDVGWGGAELEGTVYLQRFKSQNADKDAAKEENRVQMWGLFHTCIHEYLHTLAHPDYMASARDLDDTRYNTLVEGFADFFTENVRSVVDPVAVQKLVEGPYANGNAPPVVKPGVYPSRKEAERVVSIVGIKNAQAGYFRGEAKLMGKS